MALPLHWQGCAEARPQELPVAGLRPAGLDLHDRLLQKSATAKRRVRIVGKENCELPRPDGEPRHRAVIEKDDVPVLVERAGWLTALRQRHPPDFFQSSHRVLDVDVAAVCLEPRPVVAAPVLVIDDHEHAIAVDVMPSGRERRQVGRREERERAREGGMQALVARRVLQGVENHRCTAMATAIASAAIPRSTRYSRTAKASQSPNSTPAAAATATMAPVVGVTSSVRPAPY